MAGKNKRPSEEELRLMGEISRVMEYLLKDGNLDQAIYEEASHGRDAVKRFLSPLLEKKDWPLLNKVADEIMFIHKDPNLGDLDKTVRNIDNPEKLEKLNRNKPAPDSKMIERRERLLDRLRQEGLAPPQTEAQRAAVEIEKTVARTSADAAKLAKHFSPQDVEILGAENAKFLAELKDPKSPLGNAFREVAADKATGQLMNRLKNSGKGQGGSATLGAMGALLAGGTALAAGESAKDAARVAGVALVNVIPGVNVLTAPNSDEAKVRSDVALATGGSAGVGAVLGAGVGGVVTGLVGNLVSDEIRRGYARFVDGKTETVAPAAGETLVRGIASAAGQAVDTVKETLTTAVNQLNTTTPSSSGVAHAKPPAKNEAVVKR